MSYLISRSRLIEEIKENQWGWFSREMLLLMLENQPAVPDINVGNKWITCSERLPTEKEAWNYNSEEHLHEPNEFIVQVKGAELPTVAMFDGKKFTHGYAENGYGFMDEIIAWQPLPEPYKGE